MVVVVSAASVVAYTLSLFKLGGKWVQQQVTFLIIFLVGLTILGALDVLLPIYFMFSILPFAAHVRKITYFTGLVSLYFIVYILYGLVNQSAVGTLVTFIAKMWQFVVFFVVYDSNIKLQKEDYRKIVRMAVFTESLLGLYLILTSTNVDANGLVRLVSNAQPISGNISTVVLPISAYYYLKNRVSIQKTRWLLGANIIMLIWIVLSGTRGYTLEFAATMILIFYDYFTNGKVGEDSQRSRMFTIILLGVAFTIFVVFVPEILEKFVSILRLKSSVGIRTYENAALEEFMKNAPVLTCLFGIGLGGQGGSYPEMRTALTRQFALGMWNRKHYLCSSGALFHNLYANILMCLGLLGAGVFIGINVSLWKRITRSCGSQVFVRRVLHLFQLSFLLMNYYRWSAVCGISEMIILALILKQIEQNDNWDMVRGLRK